MIKVLVVAGQTATGKTALSLELAKRFNGEIINADSQQVYRGLNIGTAKISEVEKHGIPHYGLDLLELSEPFDVKAFQQLARTTIEEIHHKNKIPLLVGGTGLYLKAALYDYRFDEEVQSIVDESWSTDTILEEVKRLDPEALETIHPNNRKRLIRALEMAYQGKPKTQRLQEQTHQALYDVYWLVLTMPKQDLDVRIEKRVETMFEMGLQKEVEHYFSEESHQNYQSFQAIGYKEWLPYLKHEASIESVKSAIIIHTRQFAKRQMTWFKHQVPSRFVDVKDGDDISRCIKEIEIWLNES